MISADKPKSLALLLVWPAELDSAAALAGRRDGAGGADSPTRVVGRKPQSAPVESPIVPTR